VCSWVARLPSGSCPDIEGRAGERGPFSLLWIEGETLEADPTVGIKDRIGCIGRFQYHAIETLLRETRRPSRHYFLHWTARDRLSMNRCMSPPKSGSPSSPIWSRTLGRYRWGYSIRKDGTRRPRTGPPDPEISRELRAHSQDSERLSLIFLFDFRILGSDVELLYCGAPSGVPAISHR
jgi:hypothetical protein